MERKARSVSLDDKYDLATDQVYLTGTQALVRLCLMQRERDRRAGLATAGFVSGYRGSPLGGVDTQFTRAGKVLAAADIRFQPGLNEDLAATAIWGTQQATMRGEGRVDGVFAVWYGKGPGVDRTGDVFRHANLAGSDPKGGVLALLGDDHVAESSTTAHQSEFALVDAMMPILSPAGVQEILDYGLYGFALSRYSGCWVGLKCVKDTVESTVAVDGRVERVEIIRPDDIALPEGGLGIRPRDGFLAMEERLHEAKRPAVEAFTRANRLDRLIFTGGARPRVGIVATGKSYLDVRQALQDLGIDEAATAALGLSLYKVGVVWPLEPRGIADFALGLDLVIVVEEKRGLIEGQMREILYGRDQAPVILGKHDERGARLFAAHGALDVNEIAIAIGRRLGAGTAALANRLAVIEAAQQRLTETGDVTSRTPYFCAGCPHNTSTRLPEGARGYAGIGCHYMAQWMDRSTEGYSQMGGEGASWVGESGFSTRRHMFQNLGDGTYNHSGSLAIRFAVGAGVNITYKILFNDAVAMTGGQPHDGGLTVQKIAAQVAAEGVSRIAVVTDEPEKYPAGTPWPTGTTIHRRGQLLPVEADLAKVPGVTVVIYDQTCAAEKRRRRKRGTFPDPDRRVIINEAVCEGCGDCGVQSNCVAVQPVETPLGRKRRIDQSACNKDFSCVEGFCPSFVSVSGASPRKPKPAGAAADLPAPPEPVPPAIDGTYNILVTGVGGTGVVTVGAILSMAAHLEGKGFGVIDMAGLAQKGGAVYSHIRLAATPSDITAIRIGAGGADLLLGGDIAVAGTAKALAALERGRSRVVMNIAEVMPGEFTRDADFNLPVERVKQALIGAAGGDACHFTDANRLALALLGNTIGANLFLLGLAWQTGAVPLAHDSLMRAIEVNGEAVAMNKAAFAWGRQAAVSPERVRALAEGASSRPRPAETETLDDMLERHAAFLTAYQNATHAGRYRAFVARVRAAEPPGRDLLSRTVARNLFRLMAYKDEYEVARLFTDGEFARQIAETFEGEALRLRFHLAPPLLARRDPATGRPRKMTFGPWIMPAFRLLARLKGLRGTWADPFGRTAERRMERRLITDYQARVGDLLPQLRDDSYGTIVAIAALPERVRGFGPVKEAAIAAATAEGERLQARLAGSAAPFRKVGNGAGAAEYRPVDRV